MTAILVAESNRNATSQGRKNESCEYDWFQGIDELGRDVFLAVVTGGGYSAAEHSRFFAKPELSRAAHICIDRETRIEERHPAKFDARRSQRIIWCPRVFW
jgi:hypothetical protein